MKVYYIALSVIILLNILLFLRLCFKTKSSKEWDRIIEKQKSGVVGESDDFINFS